MALAAAARPLAAQGALSTQGFGYPSGGLSSRAIAGGAGFAEFDAISTRNPASLLGWGRSGLYAQYDPEFRSVSGNGQDDNTVTARFPLLAAAFPVGSRTLVGISATTLLDRTWETSVRSFQRLGPDSVPYTEVVQSTGGISDIRLAAGYAFSERFAIGLGAHALGGENRLHFTRTFDDTAKYGTVDRSLVLGFQGAAFSAGAVWRPIRPVALAVSASRGGSLSMEEADTVIARGHAPNRYGAGIRFDGFEGVSIAASYEFTEWTQLGPLGTTSLGVRDGSDFGVGADLSGPRMRGLPMTLHLGVRQRDLPFRVAGGTVKERQYAGGLSLPFGGPRASFDFGVVRASRSETAGVRESAWILTTGFSVRP
jgi:hypothetical protein